MKKALMAGTLLGAFAIATVSPACAEPSAAATSPEERWQEDLDVFARELPVRHVAFSKIVSPKTFQRDVDRLRAAVPRLSDAEIVLELIRVALLDPVVCTSRPKLGLAHAQLVRLPVTQRLSRGPRSSVGRGTALSAQMSEQRRGRSRATQPRTCNI
jgi:hypothetical protein